MMNLVSTCKEWYCQKSPIWLQEISIFKLMLQKKFKDLLLEFWLQQQVNVPTDRDGHTLDLFITRISDNTTLDGAVASYYRSDHAFVVNYNASEIQANWHWEIYEWHQAIVPLLNDWVKLWWKTHVTRRRWQLSTTPRCAISCMVMPRKKLQLLQWSRLCLGTTITKVSNITERRPNDDGCNTEGVL